MSAVVVESGGMDYVQLYQIQGTVLASEDAAISGRFEQIRASVDLYKAIGGGLRPNDPTCIGGEKLPKAGDKWIEAAANADRSSVKSGTSSK